MSGTENRPRRRSGSIICQYENRRNGTVAFRDVFGRTQATGSGSPDSISAAIVKGVSIEHRKNERKANFRKRYSLKMDKEAVPFPQLKVNLRVGRRIREVIVRRFLL